MATPHYPSALLAQTHQNHNRSQSQSQSQPLSYQPLDRTLPSPAVNEDNLADTYVSFILYCNPHFPLTTPTTTLRTNFLTPPKSDSKQFTTFALWTLIQQLSSPSSDLKTWSELALRLGVEPPDISKGQSAQKIQQYTVRLKRWMRAMHIDAFFEYLLGKQHVYFLQVPFPEDPYPEGGRDGVSVEEDTAVRALDPRWKPKRGRRRNSETTEGVQEDEREGKQERFAAMGDEDGGVPANPHSAVPHSAHPDGRGQQHDPWAAATSAISSHSFAPWASSQHLAAPQSAITPSVPQHLRWSQANMTPSTPHPMSAHPRGSMSSHIDAIFEANEPRSAITPSAKRRRKHGPAVSSAWPSTSNPGAKPRGRPPAARSAHPDNASQFGSFSARPRSTEPSPGPDLDAVAATPEDVQMPPPPSASAPLMSGGGRPGRLSLQVPQHTGGPVRLATPPPPQVIVSEETANADVRPSPPKFTSQADPSHISFEALKRALTTSLLRAEIINRPTRPRLAATEAKRLADAILSRLSVPRTETGDRLSAASWLGLGDSLGIPPGPAVVTSRKLQVMRFRTDEEGYEEIVDANDTGEGENVREVYDMYWTAGMGSSTGNFSLTGLSITAPHQRQGEESSIHDLILDKVLEASKLLRHPPEDQEQLAQRTRRNLEHPDPALQRAMGAGLSGGALGGREEEGNIDWRARAMAMEFGSRVAKGEMERYKQRVLEEVLQILL